MEPHVDLGERFVQSDCRVKGDDETVDSLQHRKVGRTGINRLSCKSPWIGANQLPKDFGYPEHEERDILYTSYLSSEALHLRVQ